ncbi:MAG TPA: hypothetical protein VJQ55_08805, partial [Candidatus Binatia bacterium]|nr:hypothetical protein [Candidatus Binatia bacterium]
MVLVLALLVSQASATTVFDFDDIQPTTKKKGANAAAVEAYMEGLYGSNLTVSSRTNAVRGQNFYGAADLSRAGVNAYLTAGKGKGPAGFTIDFGDNPIDSFSVDFKLFKKAKKFAIFADGELINLQTLTKAQRKQGMVGEQTLFFDDPVHTLQFVGTK